VFDSTGRRYTTSFGVVGPIGFLIAAVQDQLPWRFGYTILTNDVIWWPAFWMFALKYAVKPMRELVKAEAPDSE
jgi:hypothetical protein